jgi:hypothetical protein
MHGGFVMVDDEELRRIYNLFTDCWRYFKKYADVRDEEIYWENVVSESGELSKKYNNDKFAIALILAVVDEFERKAKELRKNAETQ